MRCLALADALRERDVSAQFLCRPLQGHLGEVILKRGYTVQWLTSAETEQADAELVWQCLIEMPVVERPHWLVVDHYGLGSVWERHVARAGVSLLAIDDLLREHACDLLLDQTLGRKSGEYGRSDGAAMTGADYALLRPDFNRYRERSSVAVSPPPSHRLLLSMGGSDVPNATGAVLSLLSRAMPEWLTVVDIVLSPSAPNFAAVKQLVPNDDRRFNWHGFVENMADLMMQTTIAIGAPGTTTWERACLGLPSVLIPIADNQRMVAESMQTADAALLCSVADVERVLLTQLQRLKDDWLTMRQRNRALVDGLGARRVAARMLPPLARDGVPVSLRKACVDDIERVFRWQQAPQTRQYARNPNPPSWLEHEQWMRSRLQADDCYFYLIYHGEAPAGVARLDRRADIDAVAAYEISIFIDPDKMRQQLARNALLLLMQIHRDITLKAVVLEANQPSHELFASVGFKRTAKEEYILSVRQPQTSVSPTPFGV